MNEFAGRIDRAGRLATDAGTPARHLGLDVLVHGALDDRTELGRRLGIDAARCAGDGELLAHAYRAWGRELQAQVVGQFAAVVVDPRAGTALLTHDALGLAPLFYAERGAELAFSTDLVGLIDSAAAAALDEEYLADYLALGFIKDERTPYRGIRRLLPGRSLWWADGRVRELRGWSLAGVAPVRCRDDGEYEERFRALLTAAVRAGLEGAGPVWSDCSGGLDSSSVTAVAAMLGGHELTAYSVVTPDYPESDERRWMRAVVERYELPWQQLDIATVLPFSRLPDEFAGEPSAAVIEVAQLRAQRELLAAHGVTTVLTGRGGDAVLGASPGPVATHLADPLFEGRPLAALRGVRAWQQESPERRSGAYWLLRSVVAPTVAHLRGESVRAGVRLPLQAWLQPDYVVRTGLRERVRRRLAPRCRQPGRQPLADSLWLAALATSSPLQRGQPFAVRAPLLYRPLVEFMCAIPWEQRLQPRCDRYLQRRALAGVLPELVRRRASKAGGSRPFIEGLRRSREWFGYLTDDPLLARHGIVDADRWRHAVRKAGLGETHGDQYFLAGVAVEAWLRQLAEHRRRLASTTPRREPAALAADAAPGVLA